MSGAPGVTVVDLWERGRRYCTSGYLIAAPRPALVDAGAARSVPVWLDTLAYLGVPPADVAYIIVTHIHLDHAGGVGILLRHLSNAQVVVHQHGARHLVDPSRLVASARGVFGEHLETYFGLPEPVPEERLLVPGPAGELDLGGGHRLRFFDAFGHARHQHVILDAGAGCLFGGDEFGKQFVTIASDYLLPDTPPTQFDPVAWTRSVDLLLTLRPQAVFLAHFGRCALSCDALGQRLREQVEAFAALGRAGPQALPWEEVRARLTAHVRRDLAARGVAWTATIEHETAEELEIWAKGIADYQARRSRPG
ncbi:MAG TPA: MBL fold metallo-hydrolase [bacterium]|nr:MBL fold metallo-hydrolase [bacterium]